MSGADKRKQDDRVDEQSKESFPASDPPSTTPQTGTRKAEQQAPHGEDTAAGHPTSDRHATETAAARQQGAPPAEAHPHTSDKPMASRN